MTPFELRLCLEARNENLVDDRARDLWHAWHTAYLGRVDKFPHLNELMPKILQHSPETEAENKPKSSVGRDLMNALLQLPAAPPPSKDPPSDSPSDPTSDSPSDSPPEPTAALDGPVAPPAEEPH